MPSSPLAHERVLPPDDWRSSRWDELAAEQDQVLARWQARATGLTDDAWNWRVRRQWQSPHPGIAVLHTGDLTERQWRWVARLCMGEHAVLSGDAALQEHGLKRITARRYDVVVPPKQTLAAATLAGGRSVVPHRLKVQETWKRDRRGLRVLSAPVSVIHAFAWADTDRAAELRLVSAVQQRVVAVSWVRDALSQMRFVPRRALLLEVLDDAEFGVHALSELDYLRLCRAHGIPEPDEMQVRVRANGTKYLDVRYRRQRIVIEIDGAQHTWPEEAAKDNLRTLEILVASEPGERVIRISSFNLRHDTKRLVPLLRQLLV